VPSCAEGGVLGLVCASVASIMGTEAVQVITGIGEPLRIGIGLHAGPVILGAMGHGRTVGLTAIGDTVNTASRLEAASKDFGCELVVSEAVLAAAGLALPDSIAMRHEVQVRGRAAALEVRAVPHAASLPAPEG